MAKKPYPLRVPEQLLKLADLRGQEERVDKSTALRQLMYMGAEEYVLDLINRGRLSIGKGAELLEVPVTELHRLAEKHNVEIGATREQQQQSEETAENLI